MSNTPLASATQDKSIVEFIPFGGDQSIKLSVKIIQELIAAPTRSGKLPSHAECMKFMMLCRARHLNPFEGDAYLLGYDGKDGPQFSLITAHQVFLKRAEAAPAFQGMESGVILDIDGSLEERQGDFTMAGEKLLGGWARVYRSDRAFPCYRRLKLETFSSGRSRWEKDAAGMIVKCAEADALRSSFPSHLGGLYTGDEAAARNIEVQVIPQGKVGRAHTSTPIEQAALESAKTSEVEEQAPPKEEPPAKGTTVAQLRKELLEKGTSIGAGRLGIAKAIWGMKLAPEGTALEAMDVATLGIALDTWSEEGGCEERIQNPS